MISPFVVLRASLRTLCRHQFSLEAICGISDYSMFLLKESWDGQSTIDAGIRNGAHYWSDLRMFLSEGISAIGYREPFFRRIACPMLQIEKLLAMNDVPNRKEAAMVLAQQLPESEWKSATTKWIQNG